MRLFIIFMLLSSAPAMAADQYDLACQGTRISPRDAAAEAYSTRLRIDLAAQKWCQDDCKRVVAINDISADTLVLADDITYNSRTDLSNKMTVDRKSGAFEQLSSQDRPSPMYLKVEATCTEQPFTPFP
ncbi:MAG TPA: hypothetical protein VNS79_00100 [Sphingobium sp.]|nr:hypothetical protein [Sphingobium sp.]